MKTLFALFLLLCSSAWAFIVDTPVSTTNVTATTASIRSANILNTLSATTLYGGLINSGGQVTIPNGQSLHSGSTDYYNSAIIYGGGQFVINGANGVALQKSGASYFNLDSNGSVQINFANGTAPLNVAGTVSATNLAANTAAIGGLLQTINLSATGGVSVTGNVSAAKFIGDGSGLTGIAGGGVTPTWAVLPDKPLVLQNISNSTGSVTVTSVNATTTSGTFGYFASVSATQVSATNHYGVSISGTTGTFGTIGTGSINASGQITASALGATLISSTAATGTVTSTNVYAKSVSASALTVAGSISASGPGILSGLWQLTSATGTLSATNVYASKISASAITVGSCSGCGGGGSTPAIATSLTTVVTCTTNIPADNTIPQSTEGDQVMTVTYTPASASTHLLVTANLYSSAASGGRHIAAIFRDSGVNAVAANVSPGISNGAVGQTFSAYVNSTATTATTFKLRLGMETGGGTAYVNGDSNGTPYMGGVSTATLSVIEVP